jgi:hypothetical protein
MTARFTDDYGKLIMLEDVVPQIQKASPRPGDTFDFMSKDPYTSYTHKVSCRASLNGRNEVVVAAERHKHSGGTRKLKFGSRESETFRTGIFVQEQSSEEMYPARKVSPLVAAAFAVPTPRYSAPSGVVAAKKATFDEFQEASGVAPTVKNAGVTILCYNMLTYKWMILLGWDKGKVAKAARYGREPWVSPGGEFETKDRTVARAAARETHEETHGEFAEEKLLRHIIRTGFVTGTSNSAALYLGDKTPAQMDELVKKLDARRKEEKKGAHRGQFLEMQRWRWFSEDELKNVMYSRTLETIIDVVKADRKKYLYV